MDYLVNYNVNNVNIHCVIQEKDAIISRQHKEIEELHKANQLLAKDINKLKSDLDLQKKLTEALEKFKYSLERHVAVLKDYDKNRWSVSEAESEVTVWEHEYLIWKKTIEKKERDETQALLMATQTINNMNSNTDLSQINEQNSAQTPKQTHRKSTPKPKTIVVSSDGTVVKRYVCDYINCNYSSNWAHDLKGHKRKHTGEKPYCCGWLNCNKSFRDLRDLKRHQRAHTGDKRYSCDWPGCDYRSTDVANLAKHKRTHTGEKPYKCTWNGCEASFADGSHLRRHQKKHENQFTKLMSKTTTPKKRQNTPKTTSVKTRQQPSRRAKGSTTRLPFAVKSDAIPVVNEDKQNETNHTNKDIDSSNKNSESFEESVIRPKNNSDNCEENTNEVNTSSKINSSIDAIDSNIESNERLTDNSVLIQQSNRCDVNKNLSEDSVLTPELRSNRSEEQNPKLDLISDSNNLDIFKNSNVMPSMIGENNRTLNSSLQQNGTKYSDLQRI